MAKDNEDRLTDGEKERESERKKLPGQLALFGADQSMDHPMSENEEEKEKEKKKERDPIVVA